MSDPATGVGQAPGEPRRGVEEGAADPVPRADERALPVDVAEQLLTFVERTDDLIGVTDDAGRVRYLNAAARRRLTRPGIGPQDLTTADIFAGDAFETYHTQIRPALLRGEVWSGYLPLRGEGEEVREMWLTVVAGTAPGGEVTWLVTAAHDVAEWRHLREELSRLATHDDLTGLATRGLLSDRLELALARARRTGRPAGLAFLDLDNLKAINDTYGHHAGDAVLVEVANRLQDAVRAVDTVARVGGDEFVVLFDGVDDDGEAEALITRLHAAAEARSVDLGDARVNVSLSVGMTTSFGDDEADQLVRRADATMYEAKGERHRPVTGSPRRPAGRSEGPSAQEIAIALTQGRITPRYWAVSTTGADRLRGVQAVASWRAAGAVPRPAATFAPVAARSGVGLSLELAILRHVVEDAATWPSPAPRLYVHTSRPFLERRGIARFVAEILDRGGLVPGDVGLVVPSEELRGRAELVRVPLWDLHQLGLHLVVGLTPASPPLVPELVEALFDEVRLAPAFADLLAADGARVAALVARSHRFGMVARLAGVVDATVGAQAREAGVDLLEGAVVDDLLPAGCAGPPAAARRARTAAWREDRRPGASTDH